MPEKVVGILGGMGPEATARFFAQVIALTRAEKDQDHLRIIIDSNPKIPDRTEAILMKGSSLFPMLVDTAKNLERAGVDFIVIPCNTVHYFYEDLRKELSVPVLHMIREVVSAVGVSFPECRRLGLLATTGTVSANLYQDEIRKVGVKAMAPDADGQAEVMAAILSIKAGREKAGAREALIKVGNQLLKGGAEGIILGCTEVPLVIRPKDFAVPVFDSTRILAEATVKFALS